MASAEIHQTKYETFKRDAENPDVSIPLRIEAYFYASFHRIESVAAASGIHIDHHQRVRRVLEAQPDIFGAETRTIWSAFQELETRIRPGQVYGSAINGENLRRAAEIFRLIESICERS